ncbi:GerAB/ArcD/ProY family transporter [Paenibacillus sp. GYB003]|uniref:GerAB/ArcD/ProY family transporter n=1 Tax=Paenibacillus sp. GYB003 TaxID=2994392 RepID=UPI002F96D714
MRKEISGKYMISPYFVMFPLYVSMVGAGIITFQTKLMEHAGYNAWISVVLTGTSIHLILWMMYRLLSSRHDGQEIISLNHTLFGKIAGNVINSAVILYFVFGAFLKLKIYIEIVQVWFFPVMNVLPLSICIALLLYYAVSGGFRSVIGVSAWATFFSLVSVFPEVLLSLPFLHPLNLLPLLNHSAADMMLASKSMVFEYLGVETLLFLYPFIRTPAKSQKWAHLILILVTCLYLLIIILTFMFFSEGQLRHSIWPTIELIGIYEVPLLQRLEYFFVSLWLLKMVAGIGIYLWGACRGMKTAFRAGQRHSLIVFLIAFVALNNFVADHRTIERVSEWYGAVGFYFIYAYIPFLFVCVLIRRRSARHFAGRKPA